MIQKAKKRSRMKASSVDTSIDETLKNNHDGDSQYSKNHSAVYVINIR